MPKKIINIFVLISLLTLQGCLFSSKVTIKGKGNIKLNQVDFEDLPNWQEDNHKLALQSFLHSCNKFSKMAQNRLVGGQIGNVTAGDFRDVCDIAEVVKTMDNNQARNFFENWFRPFLVESRYLGKSTGTFTGYYEASLNGSKIKSEKYKYPIYSKPNDLDSEEPYFSRQEIEEGALKGKNLEIIYVDDKVDLFFMHIQGSGRVRLESGGEVRIAYAGRNNQPFIGIANHMLDQGLIERKDFSSAGVRTWLKENPNLADEVMNINPAYTFFRVSRNEYIIGGQGVPLTPERSLAVDKDIIPYGLPLFVDTKLKKPDGSKQDYSHLFIAQDTGSAIKGVVRGDIFFGYGKEAEEKAFLMASQGQYYILLPINLVEKLSQN